LTDGGVGAPLTIFVSSKALRTLRVPFLTYMKINLNALWITMSMFIVKKEKDLNLL